MFKYYCILYVSTSSIESKHLKNIFVWCIKLAPLNKKAHLFQFIMKILLFQYSFLWTGCGGTVYDASKVNPFLHILTFSLFFLSQYNIVILKVEFKAQNMKRVDLSELSVEIGMISISIISTRTMFYFLFHNFWPEYFIYKEMSMLFFLTKLP